MPIFWDHKKRLAGNAMFLVSGLLMEALVLFRISNTICVLIRELYDDKTLRYR